MKRKTYILASLILTAFFSGLTIWNWSANRASAQKSDDFDGVTGVSEYNPRDEFALTQGGTNGLWNYGYSTSDADNTLNLFSAVTDTDTISIGCAGVFERWRIANAETVPQIARHNPATTCSNIPSNAVFIHPGKNNQRAVLRFNAPVSGTFQITGTFQKQALGATSDLKIIKNAALPGETVLYTGVIGAVYQQTFNFTVTIAAGDKIDFSVGDDGNDTWQGDGSSIAITIGQPIEACSIAPANLQVNVPAENSPSDVQSVNTNASLVGDATYTNMGKVGRAFELDGNGDYVRIEDNAAQRPATAVTAEGWFKFDSVSGVVSLISKPIRNSAFNSYTLYLDGGQLRGLVGNASQYTRVFSNFTPQTGVWHHLAFTYDLSGGISTLKLYANGVEVTSGQDGTANLPISYDANPFPLLIGGEFENNASGFTLDGQADEVSIYGRALSQTEIFDIVQQGSFGKCLPASCAQTPNNLVTWFAGEQNALDSRSNNHGTLVNGTTFQTAKVGQGFKFDGVDDRVEIPDSASLKPQTLTVETWVKFDSLTSTVTGGAPAGYQNIIFKKNSRVAGSGFEGGYSLVKNPDNKLGFGFNSAGGATDFANSTTAVQIGQWYHVVGTHDGANIRLYINGQLEGAGAATFPINYGTTPLYLGTAQVPFNGYFNGVLDETSIYNRALSATEIQSIYNAGSSGKCKPIATNPAANQVAWFTGDGDTTDFLGLNANGILQGDANFKVGKVGQSFNFDGSGDYVEVSDDPDQRPANITVEGWFKINSLSGIPHFVSKPLRNTDSNSYVVWYQNGELRGGHGNSSGGFDTLFTGFSPNLGTWYHFAYMIDDAADTHRFFVNGVQIATAGTSLSISYDTTTPHPLLIGAELDSNNLGLFLNGQADEVSLYSRALSAPEIAAIYNAGNAGKMKSVITPVNFVRNAKTASSFAPTTVQLSDASVTFQQVTTAGTTSENGIDLGLLPKLPRGATFTGLAYDISTTADYQNGAANDVQVCFNVPTLANFTFTDLRILHLENGIWTDRTAIGNSFPILCTSGLTSLSPFAIVQVPATSANSSVSGTVTDNFGRGLKGISVSLTDLQGRTVYRQTNNFGRYSFKEVAVGGIYTVGVASKRYAFSVSTQVVSVQEAVENVDFTATETGFGQRQEK